MDKIEAVKQVRSKTGLGIFEVKKALEACKWDAAVAIQYLYSNAKVPNKPVGTAGALFSYVHHNRKIGAI